MDSVLRKSLKARSKGRCEYCGVPESLDSLPFQPDHIIAEKHGGASTADNLAWSCYDCNIYKGPNLAGIDEATGEIVKLFHPRIDSWDEHFAWDNENLGKLIGLTPYGRATISVLRLNLGRRVDFRNGLCREGTLLPVNHETDSDEGATLVEYALLVALVGVVAITALHFLGNENADVMCQAGGVLNDNMQILTWSEEHQCCGHSIKGFVGTFACVTK